MAHAPAHHPNVSARVSGLPSSNLAEVFKLARSRDTIDLAIGTPRFPDLSPRLVEAASRALREGHNQYEDPAGHSLLRLRIAEGLTAATDPDTEITVTAGATEALLVALLATVDPGDEVIVLTPGFEQFTTTISLVGATPRFVPLHAPDWRYDSTDLAAAFTPRTRAILLNSPSNPTGRVLGRQELDEIAGLCERWNTTAICDEVYAAYVFDGAPHLSVADIPGLAERSVVIGSWSKSHAVSGWRLGFLRADPERTEAFRRVHQMTTLGTAAPLQVAAARAAGAVDVDAACEGMAARRDLAQDIFSRMGMKFAPAEGGCYLFADFSPLVEGPPDSVAYVRGLMERTGVLLTPGAAFFAEPALGESYVRIAFNRPMETLHAAQRGLLGA
ncbi:MULTISPECIES: pyridoxal phosphate-dependent aminotransferase [Streptomyces]|uniref:Pyridoxal phosphate-dependent aminotransferase n=1 Tax=Streptomyces edwardsiae TaxID=3075527 RepID=A0ABU2PPI5_9ACTN|nr:pyridoxal phosphate-dependent aminotransferase [Streptomyces sp. DSM 41636]MDT0393589.1 pyridoxal phosphate-dependent aminotransferase [Streptomyces sp. DSM 41636]